MVQNGTRQDRFIGLAVTLVVALAGLAGLWQGLDGKISEWGMRLAPERDAGDRVLLVDIDDQALAASGDWSALAASVGEALDRARRGDAQVTALVLPPDWGLAGPVADALLSSRIDGLGTVLLGLPYRSWSSASEDTALDPAWLPDHLQASALSIELDTGLAARLQRRLTGALPIPEGRLLPAFPGLGEEVSGVGFLPPGGDRRSTREAAAFVHSDGAYLPALSLHLAASMDGGSIRDTRISRPSGILLGSGQRVPTDSGYRFQPHFYSGDEGSGIPRISLQDFLEGRIPDQELRGRAVIIGTTSAQWADELDTPLGSMSPVEVVAQHSTAMIMGDIYATPDWLAVLPWALLVLVGLYLAYLLPRVSLATGIAVTVLLAVMLFNIQLVMPMARMLRLDLAMPVIALLSGHLLLAGKQYLSEHLHGYRSELSDTHRLLGEAWRAQGRLDAAFERFRLCQTTPHLLDQLYDLALDFERRRQFAKAQSVLRHLNQLSPGFSDVNARIRKLAELESKMALSGRGAVRSLVFTEDGMQKPMLGRYEIEKELGRGAMGVVYLGRDPRIGRTVAIKTVALSEEFEGEQLEEVMARFFREAETAGRLNHPSIVTIYDVGEESDLAYIAMDYLDGSSLQRYTRKGKLLPVPTVFDIAIQVAEALHYAHSHNVVHRDVKPANMIYDRRTRRIKMTDFGVACLTDASKTRTGTILGTPSYMSPEQVLGRKVDGRSDLFSLGVTFFQMLRGELPFDGQPLATLMYKIANEPHPDVGSLRLDLPPCLGTLMDKALAKRPEDRFQSGAEMAAALRACRKDVIALARKSARDDP